MHHPYSGTYLTTGQVAGILRISVSTLKRWLKETPELVGIKNNSAGWRLFSDEDVEKIRNHKRLKKRLGRRFRSTTLKPVE